MSTININLPPKHRCGVSFTFDTDMANGYSPPDAPGCHGRTADFVADKMRSIMEIAERFGIKIHFFKIANGLEDGCDFSVYREAIERGHHVDSHTYNHIALADTAPDELNKDLKKANELLKKKLAIEPVILRGPYGYNSGDLPEASRKVILENGFKFVSGEINCHFDSLRSASDAINDPVHFPAHQYPEGLIEIPIHGYSDREFFDFAPPRPDELMKWRYEYGHKPVPDGWKCPWTDPNALDQFIAYARQTIDVAYENRKFCCLCCHPYSLYLHDRENRFLAEMMQHIQAKEEPVWIGTLRDAVRQLF